MKINLAKSAGFCFGVKRAIAIAEETSKTKRPVVMLGDIVHNEDVVRQIRASGIKKISRLACGRGKTLLVRAHGSSARTLAKALKLGYRIVDATCPMVKEIHKIACGLENSGYRIIVIGDKFHDEVRGIVGQLKSKAIVIDKPANIPLRKIKNIKKAGVVAQSTQNLDNLMAITGILRKYIPNVRFHNTICNPTKIKQNEVKIMPKANDLMIIIGSKTSANTKRIYEISKSLNKNSYWINSSGEIKKKWLKGALNIGITAGASTPETTIHKITQRIKTILPR
ncbi:MAG: 4-hydroxy-3-methylbut-2-enyl diphosphate reductase [Candidatus Omnitrophica bacterium]|nr:4-hydroxy-3-methylbut-2-enyl diphosphate reductase [Candidatus Omnitrophota bacterium]MDD5661251.1 4-hydroxy-3-methylbut-2-enyl diphosphate reductase [Candidatus Omnitrophota bacterium]